MLPQPTLSALVATPAVAVDHSSALLKAAKFPAKLRAPLLLNSSEAGHTALIKLLHAGYIATTWLGWAVAFGSAAKVRRRLTWAAVGLLHIRC